MTNKTIPHDQISAGGPSYLSHNDNENHENNIVGSAPVQIKTTLTTKKSKRKKKTDGNNENNDNNRKNIHDNMNVSNNNNHS
jgi:hypothetical protein